MIRFGNKRNFEDFKPQIPNQVLPLFDSIRKFCLELGDNVIEDVRMHRIVYCKSMTFRWFLDVEPEERRSNSQDSERSKRYKKNNPC